MNNENKDFFIHTHALCESPTIGARTRIWAFSHVLPNARIGTDCNICDNVFIENDVVIADRVTIKCGVQIWDGVEIHDDVFIGPNATFTNDRFPRSKVYPASYLRTIIRKGASIGANATILPGVEIGMHAMIGAGAVVTRSVPPYGIVRGNPAKIVGYVDSSLSNAKDQTQPKFATASSKISSVSGVKLYTLNKVVDHRGNLSVGEFDRGVPFKPLRYFLVYAVPPNETRGEHAHLQCHQFLVAVKGSVHVVVDNGQDRAEHVLSSPEQGIYVPPMIWGIQYRYSSDAVLLVFASHYYEASDYIRNYDDFLAVVAQKNEIPLDVYT